MKQQLPQINLMTDTLERDLLEQELRAMAQRAAAEAFARLVRRAYAKVRKLFAGSRQSALQGLPQA